MSRKKTILTILFCIVTAGGLVVNLTFLRTTIAYKELKSFCIQNSEIDASSFSCFELDSYLNYSFWVSEDKKSDQQELFVFYKKYPFGERMNLSFQAARKSRWKCADFPNFSKFKVLSTATGCILFFKPRTDRRIYTHNYRRRKLSYNPRNSRAGSAVFNRYIGHTDWL